MANWLDRLKNLFSGERSMSPNEVEAEKIVARFLPITEADVPNDIEEARDFVQPEDIESLIALYWQLEDWQQKRALIDIMQDQFHPDMARMMLDFLRVPLTPGDEMTELAQAVALGFMDEKYDQFMTYYNDRERLARDVKEVLRKNGLKAEKPPKPENQPRSHLRHAAHSGISWLPAPHCISAQINLY